ncbi:MOSC N-terminal beta barrel domain-containing protein [Streptomyces sp. NPDC005648]|uniref:MOSC domain-containing protein n=1 Tax=Streptomyces sp. NPDC005648 TaxID=3157044 RepID=UPI0033A00081
MTTQSTTGTVTALRRYPVKSMLGERIKATEVTDRGLAGDRRLALVDRETGKVASAKTPRLWRELLNCAATLTETGADITTPDGRTLHGTGPGTDDALSDLLGRPVTLTGTPPPAATLDRSRPEQVLESGPDARVEADIVQFGSACPPGTFFDFAPVHLITTATLARIAALSPRGTVEAERYRPNLVIGLDEDGFPENDWLGKELTVGDELIIRVIALTPRCTIPTLAHGPFPRDPDALRVPSRHNRVTAFPDRAPEPCAGAYAQVVRGGRVREGDVVRV